MKIAVLSDTHIYSLEELSPKIIDQLSGVELIVHAGDYVNRNIVEDLKKLGNFRGVHGNMDSKDVKELLPSLDIIEFAGIRLGVTHPAEGGPPINLDRLVRRRFIDVDVIIYGHSHSVKNEILDGVLMFNPGSATGQYTDFKSFGLLNIDNNVTGKIIKI